MIEKIKIIGSILLLFLFLPVVIGGRIPHSIGEFLIGWVGIIVFIIIILFFLSINSNSHKENHKKNDEYFHSGYQYSNNEVIPMIDKSTNDAAILSSVSNDTIELTTSKKVNKKADIISTKDYILTKEQKLALLKVAIDFCYCSPERLYLWRGQYEILLEFVRTLKLEVGQLDVCIQEITERFFRTSKDIPNLEYYEIVKTIRQDKPFIQLINTCVKLLDFIDSLDEELIKTESYAYLVFPEILKEIGFTEKEIEDLKYGEGVYRTRDGKNIIVLQEQKKYQVNNEQEYPVSKEQMAIFKKNWTLPQFRKEFGIENRIESKKARHGSYKVCIFVNGKNHKETEVGFSNSLGYPTIEEIQTREKELMIGLSEYGNYKLYDNKIMWIVKTSIVNL